MADSRDLDAVADACIAAYAAVEKQGTEEMRSLLRAVLFLVTRELAGRGRPSPAGRPDVKP